MKLRVFLKIVKDGRFEFGERALWPCQEALQANKKSTVLRTHQACLSLDANLKAQPHFFKRNEPMASVAAKETLWAILPSDLSVIRELVEEHLALVNHPKNIDRREQWYLHNDLEPSRPLVLIESFPATDEYVTDADLVCTEDWARSIEKGFRVQRCHFDVVDDDHVLEPYFSYNWRVGVSGWGVNVDRQYSPHSDNKHGVDGSYVWEPAIQDFDRDFEKLTPRTYTVDREGTLEWKEHLEEVFDGILDVRSRGGFWWTTGMTITAINFVGLENLMLMMYDNPDGLHKVMDFLSKDHIVYAEWLEKEELLSLNNENDYIGSGSRGHTRQLPASDLNGDPVKLRDIWTLSESQETVGVGPAQFEEFVFPYQKAVTEKFGLLYYGCCEPVHSRWDVIAGFENMRSVSVSPWCDEDAIAEAMGRNYVYSRKPNPTFISTPEWDEDAIKADARTTLTAGKNCNVELVMKDVHTLSGEPWRAGRWVALVREVIAEMGY